MEKITINTMKKAAKEYKKGRIIYVNKLDYPDLFRDMDNFVFRIRPDLVLHLSSHDEQGNYVSFSEDYLAEISAMKNVKKFLCTWGVFRSLQNLVCRLWIIFKLVVHREK